MKRVSLPHAGRDVLITDRAAIVAELFRSVDVDYYSRGIEAKVERLEGRMDRLENYVSAMIHRMPENELVGLLNELSFPVLGHDSPQSTKKSPFFTEAPTSSARKREEGPAHVGFWYSESEPHFPVPRPGPSPVDKNVVKKLLQAQAVAQQRHYKGWSDCRICGKPNGTSDYRLGGFVWPEGYRHYIEEHNVPIDFQFQLFLEGRFK